MFGPKKNNTDSNIFAWGGYKLLLIAITLLLIAVSLGFCMNFKH